MKGEIRPAIVIRVKGWANRKYVKAPLAGFDIKRGIGKGEEVLGGTNLRLYSPKRSGSQHTSKSS